MGEYDLERLGQMPGWLKERGRKLTAFLGAESLFCGVSKLTARGLVGERPGLFKERCRE
tara:strand:- start:3651 stop:3827 length:177 start_codon:yes stop_codon:yes gene_type:complete